ncbi:MAG: coenzyme F420-0:L-glutamate ligase [bacterium]
MIVKTVKTRVFNPPKDNLNSFIKEALSKVKLKEKSVIVITSKIVSIGEGRCVKIDSVQDKDELIKEEADYYIPRSLSPGGRAVITIKNNILIPTAGIDESNAKDHYILWPKNPYQSARRIYNLIKKEFNLKNFGVIISDSHCVPLRWGVMGVALSYYGFLPLKDYCQTKDIFGRLLKMTKVNIVDALCSAAVLMMGEGKEQTPIALIEDVDFIEFKKPDPRAKNPLLISPEEDIYAPLLKGAKWQEGGL